MEELLLAIAPPLGFLIGISLVAGPYLLIPKMREAAFQREWERDRPRREKKDKESWAHYLRVIEREGMEARGLVKEDNHAH